MSIRFSDFVTALHFENYFLKYKWFQDQNPDFVHGFDKMTPFGQICRHLDKIVKFGHKFLTNVHVVKFRGVCNGTTHSPSR